MPITKSYQLQNSLSRDCNWGKTSRLYSIIPGIFFNIFWIPLKLILTFFFRIKLETQTNLKDVQGPLIIVCNHASWIDPFVISIVFPFLPRAFPTHYAVWWKYYYFPLFTPLLWLWGGFPVRPRIGLENSLAVPIKILNSEGVVGIFPTGKRTRKHNKNNPPRPKRGTAFLAIKTNTPILPIRIDGNIGMSFKTFLQRKHRLKVSIGKPFYLPSKDLSKPENLNNPSDYIMKKINSL